jgi:hypothetical protein
MNNSNNNSIKIPFLNLEERFPVDYMMEGHMINE